MEEKKKWDLLALASIPLVMTLGNSMLIPVLPEIGKELNISSFQVSLIITVYSIVAILLIPIAGYLSDRLGRKKIIIPSLFIAGIGGLISGWAAWQADNAFTLILIGRFLQGVGSSGAAPVVLPLVGDMFDDEEQVSSGLGLIETSNTIGKVLSPILGAFLATIIWFLPFWLIPVFCFFSILLVLFLVKVPKKEQEKQPIKEYLKNIKQIFHNEGRWLFAIFLIGGIIMFVLFGILFYLSTILEEKYGVTGIMKGLVIAVPLLALSIASYIAGKKIKQNKLVMKWCTFLSMVLLGGSVFLITFTENVYFLLGALFVAGIGIGAALPSLDALITEGIEKEARGTITSIYSSMRFVGVALGPPIYAVLMRSSHEIVFYTSAGVSVLGAIAAFFAIKPEKERGGGDEEEKDPQSSKKLKPALE
ncbi:MFS transporter [Fictibacillus barbaricus]|uniref:MFS transporter n=1 Tax=Fictibacillus barbaricus TaxID=182136 RepID=A0ABS2ZD89_9BACL|nr:MFS transporter [Fictibacillus barbaricus]MBN3545667.1 MFS transporter [Fictibacillus barbaricus]GGB55203.1 multidrug resistance protein [Fictibacillus barbaricus]